MEILSEVKPQGLRQFITPLPRKIENPYTNEETQSLHIIDDNKARHKFISELITRHFHLSSTTVILLDLDYSWNVDSTHYQALKNRVDPSRLKNLILKKNIATITDLIKYLKSIGDATFCNENSNLLDKSIGLIIIDNISVFHWAMITNRHFPMEYFALFQSIKTIQEVLNCSVVTSSLNKFYETGLLSKQKSSLLKDSTLIPVEIFQNKSVLHLNLRGDDIEGHIIEGNRLVPISSLSTIR